MKVAGHLRAGPNKTNRRTESLCTALSDYGLEVVYSERGVPVHDADLVVQTGFARSEALLDAIEREVPYIIMEASPFRTLDINEYSSWGYNGLAGGAWRPDPPSEERWKPELKPIHDGDTLIIGQKPTDHSLRGSDHVKWLLERFEEYPQGRFRPHPLMVAPDSLIDLESDLASAGLVVTYTSTAGVDARIAGCRVRVDGRGSFAGNGDGDREEWLHRLSWYQAKHEDYKELIPYILSGYDEALARAENGDQEIPRGRVDGPAICQRYYSAIRDWEENTQAG